MKSILCRFPIAVATIGLALSAAHAAVFDFSYTFGDGVVASGSLTGTQNGLFIENVTGISLFINGAPVPGTLYASQFDGINFAYLNGPVISFDALQNNFVFSNSDLVNGDYSYDSIFYMLNQSIYADTAVAYSVPQGVFSTQDFPTVGQNWLLAPQVQGVVSDHGSSIVLFILALMGLAGGRNLYVRTGA